MLNQDLKYIPIGEDTFVKLERGNRLSRLVTIPLEVFLCHDVTSIDNFMKMKAFGTLNVGAIVFELVGHVEGTEVELMVRGILSPEEAATLAIPSPSVCSRPFTLTLGHVLGRRVEAELWARTQEEAYDILVRMRERLEHHRLKLSASDVDKLLEAFASLGRWNDPEFAYRCTQEEFIAHLDAYLVFYGYIEDMTGTADCCPICEKAGKVSTPKHVACLPSLLMRHGGYCKHCENPAQTIEDWEPVCNECAYQIQEQRVRDADY